MTQTLSKSIDFAVVISASNCNPNGDPLSGNLPRTDYRGHGEISDVAIKRKIRDRLAEDGQPILIQAADRKTDNCTSIRDRVEKGVEAEREKRPGTLDELACRLWYDVRAFGALLAWGAKEQEKKTKGKKPKGVSVGIRGPITVQMAISVDPVDVISMQITKSVNSEGDGTSKGSDTMGTKHRIDKGVYVFYGSINPHLASKTKFSDKDAEVFLSVLPRLFINDESAARPAGSMEVLKVVTWTQNTRTVSPAKTHRSLHVTSEGDVTVDELEGVATLIVDGI